MRRGSYLDLFILQETIKLEC